MCQYAAGRVEAGAAVSGHVEFPVSRTFGAVCLAVFIALLIGLPLAAAVVPSQALAVFDSFYRAGSLVFGGGHVVLPLLEAEDARERVGDGQHVRVQGVRRHEEPLRAALLAPHVRLRDDDVAALQASL